MIIKPPVVLALLRAELGVYRNLIFTAPERTYGIHVSGKIHYRGYLWMALSLEELVW